MIQGVFMKHFKTSKSTFSQIFPLFQSFIARILMIRRRMKCLKNNGRDHKSRLQMSCKTWNHFNPLIFWSFSAVLNSWLVKPWLNRNDTSFLNIKWSNAKRVSLASLVVFIRHTHTFTLKSSMFWKGTEQSYAYTPNQILDLKFHARQRELDKGLSLVQCAISG